MTGKVPVPFMNTGEKPQSIVEFVNTGPAFRVGGFVLRRLADGSLWLENAEGEGMQFKPQMLERFFKEMF